jgi:hypothetical protein
LLLFIKYYRDDEANKDEMGGSFSTYQRDEMFFVNSGDDGMLENQRESGKFKKT